MLTKRPIRRLNNRLKLFIVFYIRVSTKPQAEEGISLEAQLEACLALARVLYGDDIVWQSYVDGGLSGKQATNRPELMRMMKDVRGGKVDAVITWKVSRLGRKLTDSLQLVDQISNAGVEFVSVKEGKYGSPNDKLKFNLLASVAEYQREELGENVQLGMAQRATEGMWNGGQVLGYRSEEQNLVQVPSEASIVQLIFRKYVEDNLGTKKLTNYLNACGYRTKTGKPFRIDGVYLILRNPVYKGYVRFNQVVNWSEHRRQGKNDNPIIAKGVHEPIVSDDLWDQAQQKLQQRATGAPRQYSGTFPLTGMAKCPQCGSFMTSMYGAKRKDGTRPRYYVCGAYHNSGQAICGSNSIRADVLEAEVWRRLTTTMTSEEILNGLTERINRHIAVQCEPAPGDEAEQLYQHLNSLKEQKTRIHQGYEAGIYTATEATEKLKPIRDSIVNMEQEIEAMTQSTVASERGKLKSITSMDLRHQLQDFLSLKDHLDVLEFRKLLQTCVRKIEIHNKTLKNVHFSFVAGCYEGSSGSDSDAESDPEDPLHRLRRSFELLSSRSHLMPKTITYLWYGSP